jgi:hypothetical protein
MRSRVLFIVGSAILFASAIGFLAWRLDLSSWLLSRIEFESVSQKRAARAVLGHVARWPDHPLAGAHLSHFPISLAGCTGAARASCVVLMLEGSELPGASSKASVLAARLEQGPPKSADLPSGYRVFIVPIVRRAGYTGDVTPASLHRFTQASPIVVSVK